MKCHVCRKAILLPNGQVDGLARPGDLCDDCAEDEVEHAREMQEWREEIKLDNQLRRRPVIAERKENEA